MEDRAVFAEILTESIQKSIDKNVYGTPATVEVIVAKDDSDAYGLAETEMNKLEEALFPGK